MADSAGKAPRPECFCGYVWSGGLTITHTEQGETILSGLVVDQAALHGLLAKLRDLGLSILSINAVETEP